MTKTGSSTRISAQTGRLTGAGYESILADVTGLLEAARRASARTVNSVMTATYWQIGRRIVEFDQRGGERAKYGEALLVRLASDLTAQFGRGFSKRNLELMRRFYLGWPIAQTLSAQSSRVDANNARFHRRRKAGKSEPDAALLVRRSPLPWSHYVQLLAVEKPEARKFYEAESLRGGWTVRQLDRQINTQFYERTMLSRDKAAMLHKGAVARPGEAVSPEEEIKDPLVPEFLGLKDEYSESELEEALIRELESFLLELGGDFAFVGRQRRLRLDDEWYRIDLLFYHRRLRCLVVIDLKLGKFTHADAGQLHLYLNYAREHWTNPGENPPVGLILCLHKGEAVARYALEGLPNKVLAAEYRTALPDERTLAAEVDRTRRRLEARGLPSR